MQSSHELNLNANNVSLKVANFFEINCVNIT